MRQNVEYSELYRCPKCDHIDQDESCEGFWEQGDDVWFCPSCGELVTIIPHPTTASAETTT